MELQDELMSHWERTRKTVIMVTHDVDEALLLAHRVVMMTRGPAATVRQIIDIPFRRPREREELLARPDYFWLRDFHPWLPRGPGPFGSRRRACHQKRHAVGRCQQTRQQFTHGSGRLAVGELAM